MNCGLSAVIKDAYQTVQTNYTSTLCIATVWRGDCHLNGMLWLFQRPHGIKPQMFKTLIGRGHPEFSTKRQQDAQEFILHLLNMTDVRVWIYYYRYCTTDIALQILPQILLHILHFLATHCTDIAVDIVISLVRDHLRFSMSNTRQNDIGLINSPPTSQMKVCTHWNNGISVLIVSVSSVQYWCPMTKLSNRTKECHYIW